MRKSAARTRKAPPPSPISFDIAGIAVVAFGVISLVSLASPGESGELGRDIEGLLRLLSGTGAYIVPALAFLVGSVLLFGQLRVQISRRVLAAAALWVVFISWLHLLKAQGAQPGLFFSESAMRQGGGYIGAGLAYFLTVALGKTGGLVVLAAAATVCLILILDVPVFSALAALLRSPKTEEPPARTRKTEKPARTQEPESEPALAKPDRTTLIARAIESRNKAAAGDDMPSPASKEILVAQPPKKEAQPQPSLVLTEDDQEYTIPPIDLLDDSPPIPERSAEELSEKVEIIERTLQEFKITANVVEIAHGPTVTRYEIELAPGIKVNKIVSLADNIAMSLAAINVRVEAPIPGKAAIGVEVPNRHRGLVGLKDVLHTAELVNHPSKLAFPLGLDVAGRPVVADLSAMPHILVAGATNMGKSVMLNSFVSSLLFRASPKEVKLILVDPKRVELSLFEGIPHLICPVIRDVRTAAGILRAAVQEMERRYDKLSNKGTRNILGYNEQVEPRDRMPYIVIVVDELNDLMMQAGPEVEGSVCRIAQLARAVGIHLVIATQRPSVDVITGTIKANIASRIAFAMMSHVDSRTILDQNGAERLVGKGDMLFRPIDAPKPLRIQGAFMSDNEVKRLVAHLREQRKPEYILTPVEAAGQGQGEGGTDDAAFADEYYEPAVRLVVLQGRASTSMIQRRYRIGYTRAARLVDAMEQQGIVGPPDGANPREVLISPDQIDEILGLPSGTTAAERDPEYEDEEDNEEEPF